MADEKLNTGPEEAKTPEVAELVTEEHPPADTEEPKKPRRGRPPKAEKSAPEDGNEQKTAGARRGRPPKADKAAPDKPQPSKRDKLSRSDGKAPDAKEPIKPETDKPAKETIKL